MRIVVAGGYAPSLLSLRGPLLKRLVALGHEVHALAPLHTPDVGPQLEALGVEYSIIPLAPGVFNPFADISSLLHFKQIMHRINPDLVFSYSFKPVVFGALSARMAWVAHKKRVYGMVTGLGYDFLRDSGLLRSVRFAVTKSMYRSGLRACDGVIFQKDEDESLFRTLNLLPDHAETTVINGTGVDLEEYDVAPLPERRANRHPGAFFNAVNTSRMTGANRNAGSVKSFERFSSIVTKSSRFRGTFMIGDAGVNPPRRAWNTEGVARVTPGFTSTNPALGNFGPASRRSPTPLT